MRTHMRAHRGASAPNRRLRSPWRAHRRARHTHPRANQCPQSISKTPPDGPKEPPRKLRAHTCAPTRAQVPQKDGCGDRAARTGVRTTHTQELTNPHKAFPRLPKRLQRSRQGSYARTQARTQGTSAPKRRLRSVWRAKPQEAPKRTPNVPQRLTRHPREPQEIPKGKSSFLLRSKGPPRNPKRPPMGIVHFLCGPRAPQETTRNAQQSPKNPTEAYRILQIRPTGPQETSKKPTETYRILQKPTRNLATALLHKKQIRAHAHRITVSACAGIQGVN
jgi:hypothetical protein